MYIITMSTEGNRKQFYALDHTSGGCSYWSFYITHAKFFNTKEEAETIIQGEEFTENINYIDLKGNVSTCPPRMIHNGLNLSNSKLKGEGILSIEKIKFEIVTLKQIKGEIINS